MRTIKGFFNWRFPHVIKQGFISDQAEKFSGWRRSTLRNNIQKLMGCGNEHASMLTLSLEMISRKKKMSFSLTKSIVKSPMSILLWRCLCTRAGKYSLCLYG